MKKDTVKSMIIVLMLLAVGLYFISGTYARYASTASGSGNVTVAKWKVAIGGKDASSANAEFDITFKEMENANVVDGVIAPGSTLYAEFVIDPTDSQVAMDYSFTLSEITGITGLAISKVVTVDGETETELTKDAESGEYTGSIDLTSQTSALTDDDAVTVKVYVEWTDAEANNATDTAAGVDASTITMTVNATATQKI